MMESHFLLTIFKQEDFEHEELGRIVEKFKRVTFKKNEYLLREGQIENNYWFIETGFARSYLTDIQGNDITTNFYGAGDIAIDWSSFFLRHATRENMQALTNCVCWQTDYQSFQELFHSIKTFREEGRTRLVGSYFALKNHSISIIADPAKDRYLQLMKEKPKIVQNVSLKYIATYLGITNSSLSRIRKDLM